MPIFRYEAINQAGKISSGTFTADNAQQVEEWLLSRGQSPINVELSRQPEAASSLVAPQFFENLLQRLKDKFTGVKIEDLILYCRQMSTMLSAGVAVLPAMKIMAKQIKNPVLNRAILEINDDIEGGSNLSEAYTKYPKIFNLLFRNVIRIGEESGHLDSSFNYLAGLFENEKDINERIKAATRYPKIVIIAILGAVTFLMTFVLPKFIKLFAAAKVALPLPTRILMAVSNIFAHYFLLIIIGVGILVFVYRQAMKNRELALLRDRWLLRIPIFGELTIKIYMSRFCRVLSVLISSGIDIINALTLASSAFENMVLFNMAGKVTEEVEEGVDLNTAMSKQPLFPELVVQMVAVGEESGEIDTMMDKVANYYDVETNYTIKNLATLIEPILLLFLGLMVGIIALAIFMPMWNMMEVMKG